MMCYTFNIMILNKMYLGKQHFLFQSPTPQTFQFFLGRTAEQKGKNAHYRLFRYSLNNGDFTS